MRKSVDTFTMLLSILVILVAARVGTSRQGEGDVWWKVDEYSNISWREERVRLKEFIARLRAERESTAYIVAFGGRVSCQGEAQRRSARVKLYLTKVGGIQSERIKTIDAGHYDQWMISLYVAPPNAPPLTANIVRYADIEPAKIQILKSCKNLPSQKQRLTATRE